MSSQLKLSRREKLLFQKTQMPTYHSQQSFKLCEIVKKQLPQSGSSKPRMSPESVLTKPIKIQSCKSIKLHINSSSVTKDSIKVLKHLGFTTRQVLLKHSSNFSNISEEQHTLKYISIIEPSDRQSSQHYHKNYKPVQNQHKLSNLTIKETPSCVLTQYHQLSSAINYNSYNNKLQVQQIRASFKNHLWGINQHFKHIQEHLHKCMVMVMLAYN